jgi:protein-tyrosine phosphatase
LRKKKKKKKKKKKNSVILPQMSSVSVFRSSDENVQEWLTTSLPTLNNTFNSLHTLSLSHSSHLTDAVVSDLLAPRLLQLVELFLPHNPCILAASCVSMPHWTSLERLSLHACLGLTSLWLSVDDLPLRLAHVDVTDASNCHIVPSDQARVIASRGGRWGVECDQPQIVFEGCADDDDTGTMVIGTNALTVERLCALQLDAVVSLCAVADLPSDDAIGVWLRADEDRNHLHIVVDDDPSATLPFAETTAFLARHRGKRRLVHCVVGASRSAATIAVWLIADRGMSLDSALRQLRAVRPICEPNAGFLAQLTALST